MRKYGRIERMIGKGFDSFPRLRHNLKNAYQHMNYWWFKERGFQSELHPEVTMVNPFEWISKDPEKHDLFFGYYDKSPWSKDGSKAIFHQLAEGRAEIVLFDKLKNQKSVIGESRAWNYQQGTMLQWVPETKDKKLIYNDLVDEHLVSRIVDISDGSNEVIPYPIQTLHPNGKEALTLNYKRLYRLRPQYGYSAEAVNFRTHMSLEEDGIWKVSLETGKADLIIDLATLANCNTRDEMMHSEHKVNHIIYSPNGDNFVFMHRWLGSKGKFSRLYVANSNGKNLTLLMDDRMVSHYSWYDEEHVLAWARTKEKGDQYYLINVINGEWRIIGEGALNLLGDGHPSFSPDKRWIITDSYPDKSRQRHLLLYNIQTNRLLTVGRFFAPMRFNWDTRVDLHPRWSPDGTMISIDSCHEGLRYSYMIDISKIVG